MHDSDTYLDRNIFCLTHCSGNIKFTDSKASNVSIVNGGSFFLFDNNQKEVNVQIERCQLSRISFINSRDSYIFHIRNNLFSCEFHLVDIEVNDIISPYFNDFINYNESNNLFKNISFENSTLENYYGLGSACNYIVNNYLVIISNVTLINITSTGVVYKRNRDNDVSNYGGGAVSVVPRELNDNDGSNNNITILLCNFTQCYCQSSNGGALFVNTNYVSIKNCSFKENSALNSVGNDICIFNNSNKDLIINKTIIIEFCCSTSEGTKIEIINVNVYDYLSYVNNAENKNKSMDNNDGINNDGNGNNNSNNDKSDSDDDGYDYLLPLCVPFVPCVSLQADEQNCSSSTRPDCFLIPVVEDSKHDIIWGAKCVDLETVECAFFHSSELCSSPIPRTNISCHWEEESYKCADGIAVNKDEPKNLKRKIIMTLVPVVVGTFVVGILVIGILLYFVFCRNKKKVEKKHELDTSINASLTENPE
jgi:hypothetical protein